ncbi:MAG: TonB-dependent receptor plug domain-containing protein [Chitinophagaceae bacterium]|nr:TonB-dependent receptor plug domain-containing protein [Chitinophagaceae bacterium]
MEDEETGEKLPGASIYIPGIEKGTITNNYGFFSITVTGSISELIVSYSGYKLYHNNTGFDTDMQLTVKLKSNRELEEIIVAATKNVPIQEQSQMSKVNVPVSIIKNMPRFFGEADVLKTLQLLPGISQGTEGTSGILVRGGTPDQNLMLLDGTPVYNASHLFGIFSTFNTSALKNVDVYKGGFPARFGSRLSSVVDIVTKDGNMKQIHGEANIGLLAASFTLEGPLKKDKTSFLISGRRTYLDLIAEPLLKSQEKEVKKFAAYFYDINLKLHHILSSKDRLFFSFYQGGDVLKFRNLYIGTEYFQDDKIEGGWGNIISAVRWNHVFSKKLFANTLINFTRYKLLSDLAITSGKNGATDMSAIKYFSSIYDVGSRIDFDYRPRPEHSVKFGASALQHFLLPEYFL